ncbi:hypothetical protein GCM10009111_14020 [Colwellia asteriadis]|uniref:Glycosyl transferase family 28 C-terminal domain-containing protein n=2 Tax=Colwellia asteriadis TaxID=517723 RepID=A0ABN1L6G2_9GAMM
MLDTFKQHAPFFLPIKALVLQPDVVVFDVPYPLKEKVLDEKNKGRKVVCLDCIADTAPDTSLFIFKHPEQVIIGPHFIGYEHIIIRDEFFKENSTQQYVNNTRARVLVVLGGADVKGQSFDTAKKLAFIGYSVTLILGPLATIPTVEEQQDIQILTCPENVAELMASADFCVVNGGGCLFEALFLKKPCVVLPQTQAELNIAQDLMQKQQLLGVGEEFIRLFSKQELLKKHNQINQVDGLGLPRISTIITKLLGEYSHAV